MRLAPGGPFDGERALDPAAQRANEERFGLNRPWPEQYLRTVGGALIGDFGLSYKQAEQPVLRILLAGLPASAWIGALALLTALAAGLTAGALAVRRPGGALDRVLAGTSAFGMALPAFVVGPLLALLFARLLGWLPALGWDGFFAITVVLPVVTLAIPFAARIARLARAGLLEALTSEHVRTARAKGASPLRVLIRHAAPTGLAPVIAFLGPASAGLLTGSVAIEMVFQIPGIGREFVFAAINRDYSVVMGTVMLYGALVIACNLAADLTQAALDPRVRRR